MLVLTRRPVEVIDMTLRADLPKGTKLDLTVLGVVGNQVRFGINAPKSVLIDRHEISVRKEKEAKPDGEDCNVA